MKLGIIANPTPESFQKTQDRGLEFVEFCINIGEDVAQFVQAVPELKRASEQTGVAVGSIGRWGPDRIDASGNMIEEELQQSYRLIEAAAELGCNHFVVGCNYVEALSFYDNCSAAIRLFAKLIEFGKKYAVNISVYNCDWNNFVVEDLAWKMIAGHLPELGIKYDPSHARYAGRNYLQEMIDWGDRFHHIHLKGSLISDGKRFDDPPAGMDQTDWGAFMAILYGKKYAGGLSIEPHSSNWTGALGEQGIDFTIRYMKQFLFKK